MTKYALRTVALLYLLFLLILPVVLIGWRTFEKGVRPVVDALTNPDAIHAFEVTGSVALWTVIANTLFGVGAAILLVRHGETAGNAARVVQRPEVPLNERGIRQVEFSSDGGGTWSAARLGDDLGKFSFRRWHAEWTPSARGEHRLQVRAVNSAGEGQPAQANWNRGGFMRNVIEEIGVTVV